MKFTKKNILYNIAASFLVAMFFSCTNNTKKVRDLLAIENKPIGIAKNISHKYKDSGVIAKKMITPLLYDFSNRKEHPYNEFPEGIKIISIEKNGKDSTTISGNYAISYSKTAISELKGDVVIINHSEGSMLQTNQLFWDQKEAYFFTEDGFRLITKKGDTINGFGFESNQDLTKHIAKDISGKVVINKKDL